MRWENLKSLVNWWVQSPASHFLMQFIVRKTSQGRIFTWFEAVKYGKEQHSLHFDLRWATIIKRCSIWRPFADIADCLAFQRDHMHIKWPREFLLNITDDDFSSGDCSHAQDNHLDPKAPVDICILADCRGWRTSFHACSLSIIYISAQQEKETHFKEAICETIIWSSNGNLSRMFLIQKRSVSL